MAKILMIIYPYRLDELWVFDDDLVGLIQEPFLVGVSEMIDIMTRDLPNAHKGFRLIFSANPFPSYQARLVHQREENRGYWYTWKEVGKEGWLCPALLRYFSSAPSSIYCKAESEIAPLT